MKKLLSVILSVLMTLTLCGAPVFAEGEATDTTSDASTETTETTPFTGWKTVGSKKYYYVKNQKVTGLYKIGSHYYFFNKNGVMQNGTTKDGKTTYFLLENGVLDVRKVGKAYYNKNNQRIDYWDGYEYETILRAKKIVARITKKSDSKATKRLKAFKWVMRKTYKTRRKFRFTKGWMAVHANDHFLPPYTGDCHGDACAFAYLAYAIGYKNVKVCCDSKAKNHNNHCFAEINGRVFDPLFAEAKSFKKNYNVTYKTYIDGKQIDFKVPYATMKPVKK